MREKFSEKVYLGRLFKTTSTQNQYSANEFRESAHVVDIEVISIGKPMEIIPGRGPTFKQTYLCD